MFTEKISSIKGIGPRREEAFSRLGLNCVEELIRFYPREHIDCRTSVPIAELRHGDTVMVRVVIMTQPKLARIRKGLDIVSVQGQDDTGRILLCWFNQPYRKNAVNWGDAVYAVGRVDKRRGIRMTNPAVYAQAPGLMPVYPLVKGLTQAVVRDSVRSALEAFKDRLPETLPGDIIKKYGLCSLQDALRNVHFPDTPEALSAARRRLSFEDMLLFSLMTGLMKKLREGRRGEAYSMQGVMEGFAKLLPYSLTNAQQRAVGDISRDLSDEAPMNRLLQGDVGSGKTAVAFFAMYAVVKNGKRALMMAPTEILARQHYANASALFGDRVALLVGGMKKSERDAAYEKIKAGADIIIGTHALISESASFDRLGLVVTDEQHRFGVRQRAALSQKGEETNVLIMSATPIPRTLALLIYGDLDLSVIDELPPGRKPVKTAFVPEEKRQDMYSFIDSRAMEGKQAYIVCPLVKKSEAMEDVLSATELHEELEKTLSSKVGLLHGQLAGSAKERATEQFCTGETPIIVATSVVEVGMDISRASVMAVEDADRFGLAQLHQLRGRVGRSDEQSYCFLLSGAKGANARKRLETLVNTNNGFEIAEQDLLMRGPGELLGERQHGMDGLALALADDMQGFRQAADAAADILKSAQPDCALVQRAMKLIREKTHDIAAN